MNQKTKTKVAESERGYIGIKGVDVTSDSAQMYNMPTGVYVSEVISGGGAEKAGITKGAVGMYETDKRKPDYDTLIKLADLFNVSTDYLLSHTVDSISKTSNHSVSVSLDSSRYSKQGLYILELYESMNEESQAILYGKARELIREQRLEEKSGNRDIQKAN